MFARPALIGGLAAAALTAVFTLGAPVSAQVPNGVPVQVTNTNAQPVPVALQGGIGVTGPVDARQFGSWNMGILGPVQAQQSGTWTVGVSGTVGTYPVVPATEFHQTVQHVTAGSRRTLFPATGLLDPSDRLAVTSIVITSRSGGDAHLFIEAAHPAVGQPCDGVATTVRAATVAAAKIGTTVNMTFPQPLVVTSVQSTPWCLRSVEENGTDTFVTIVGYKL